jgi:predicted amidohydrolase YtcJ
MRQFTLICLVGILFVAGVGIADDRHDLSADLAIINAKVWTADRARANVHVEAFAVRDGRFIAVGSNDVIKQHIGESTRVIDAEGRRALPGLIDTHVHVASAADDFQHLYLREARSREHLLEMIREHAETLAEDDWLIGVRWTAESWPDQRPPNADEIEEAAGGRRAVLMRMDGHMLLASRSALEYSEITRDGPDDPPGGRIGRDADGMPNGAIYEQAMRLVRTRMPSDGNDDGRDRFRRALREANRVGLTQVGAIEVRSTFEHVLVPMDRDGELTLRIAGTVRPTSDRRQHWFDMFQWAAENRGMSPLVRIIGFKAMMDGTLGSRTAWMMEPYLDNPDGSDNAGFPLALAGSEVLREFIVLGAAENLQPAVHAIGDRANHVLLEWLEDIPQWLREQIPPRIEHAQHLLPEDLHRFAELNVIASMQPLHKADDGRYAEQRLGRERLRTSYAYRSLINSGATLAFGSDWPVVSVNPFLGIHAAVTSKTLDGKLFLPQQAITVEQALAAYTRGASICLLSHDSTGMIRTGYLADFIIIDRDILEIDPDEIAQTQVLLTVLGGEVVYEQRD